MKPASKHRRAKRGYYSKSCIRKKRRYKGREKNKNKLKNGFLKLFLSISAAYVLYIFISVLYLFGLKWSFYFIAENIDINNQFKPYICYILIGIYVIIFFKITHIFYRLKQNKNTVFLYGLFEYSFGVVILVTAGLTFIDEFLEKSSTILGIKWTTYITFYGAIYVMVRGLETMNRYFNLERSAKILFIDLKKETYISSLFNKFMEFK